MCRDRLSCLVWEEKRSNITCFEAQNPSTTMEDYELQFTMQRLKKDIEISTRTISVLKSAMTKKQNIIDRMKNPSQQVTPVTAVKTSNTEPACDTNLSCRGQCFTYP